MFITSCSSQEKNDNLSTRKLSDIDTLFVDRKSDSLSLKGIKSIPSEVFNQTQLTYLSVWGQDCDMPEIECYAIREIPKDISKLKNLTELRLTLNYIEKLPVEILELKSLRILDLTENLWFSDIETVIKMNWLKEFSCFGCYLSDSDIEKLKKGLPDCKIGIN